MYTHALSQLALKCLDITWYLRRGTTHIRLDKVFVSSYHHQISMDVAARKVLLHTDHTLVAIHALDIMMHTYKHLRHVHPG